jgi:di/tricarboxylate transporter
MSMNALLRSLPARAIAAALCLAVAWIHVQDQGGFPGDKTPGYVGVGYYVLEATGVLCAVLLLFVGGRLPTAPLGWLVAAGVALGPLAGFVLSRGPGLPDYSDDKGNWTEPLGLISVAVEVVLLTLAVLAIVSARAQAVAVVPVGGSAGEPAPDRPGHQVHGQGEYGQ